MNIEYGLVAGYLFAWGVSRAKAAGDAVGAITDKTLQAALTRLETVVRNRLGTNEAIEDLDEETTATVAAPADSGDPAALSAGTHGALVRSLERAVRKTPDFATELANALTAVQAADPAAAATGGVTSTGGGTTAGGNVTITANGPGSVAVGGNTRDITLTPPTPSTGTPFGGTPADPSHAGTQPELTGTPAHHTPSSPINHPGNDVAGGTSITAAGDSSIAAGAMRDINPDHSVTNYNYYAPGTDRPVQWPVVVGQPPTRASAFQPRSAAERERTLPTGHPDTLTTRNNLALAYRAAGRTTEAINLQERVLADSERTLPIGHPHTLGARGNLAASYWSAGRTGKAIDLQERVLADSERTLGTDHPHTLGARGNLAHFYQEAGRTTEAIHLQEQVLADSERLLDTDDTREAREAREALERLKQWRSDGR